MMREPNTVPIPAPDPATPTVAAPAPINLAAESMSRDTGVVWKLLMAGRRAGCLCFCTAGVCTRDWLDWDCVTMLLSGLKYAFELEMRALLAAGAINLAQANILLVF